MELIALLSSGEGTWAQVSGLMAHGDWDNIIIIGDDSAKDFKHEKEFEFIKIDLSRSHVMRFFANILLLPAGHN